MTTGGIRFIPISRRQARSSPYAAFTDGRIAALDLTRKAPTRIKIYSLPITAATKMKATFVYRYNGEAAPKDGTLLETHKFVHNNWVKQ